MSKSNGLREFQNALSQRIQNASKQTITHSHLAARVGKQNWLFDLNDISEIIEMPACINVPLTQQWFLGVSNVRGRLYTVVDLAAYARTGNLNRLKLNRLLLTHPRFGSPVALLVEQALGLRDVNQMRTFNQTNSETWQGATYQDDDDHLWHQIKLEQLVTDPNFQTVSTL